MATWLESVHSSTIASQITQHPLSSGFRRAQVALAALSLYSLGVSLGSLWLLDHSQSFSRFISHGIYILSVYTIPHKEAAACGFAHDVNHSTTSFRCLSYRNSPRSESIYTAIELHSANLARLGSHVEPLALIE